MESKSEEARVFILYSLCHLSHSMLSHTGKGG